LADTHAPGIAQAMTADRVERNRLRSLSTRSSAPELGADRVAKGVWDTRHSAEVRLAPHPRVPVNARLKTHTGTGGARLMRANVEKTTRVLRSPPSPCSSADSPGGRKLGGSPRVRHGNRRI
jgi:hypothetical protein